MALSIIQIVAGVVLLLAAGLYIFLPLNRVIGCDSFDVYVQAIPIAELRKNPRHFSMATQSASMFSSGTPSSTSTRSQSPPSGLPPAEYVIRRKVEQARQWLAAGRAVTDAAFDLGFSTSQYFATAFKRITNLRPRDVRPGRQVTEIVP